MGLKDWVLGKTRKALNDAFSNEDTTNLVQNDEVEKASYSKHSYKKVQKLREKGKYYSIDVPYLQHPVTKQEKPRPLFLVLGSMYALASIAILILSIMIVTNFLLPLIGSALQISGMAKIQMWDIFGLVAMVGSVGVILVWAIVIVVAALIIAVNTLFIYQTVNMFSLSKISMQEMAKGYEVGNMLFRLGAIIVTTLIAGIAILVLTRKNITPQGIWLVVGVMVAVCAIAGTIFGLLLAQRLKAKKQFEELSEEQQKDFIRHNQVLHMVNRSKNIRNNGLFDSSTVDF